MSKTEKRVYCKSCGEEFAATAKFCPSCGAKNKKSIFKKWWFWLIIAVVIIAAISSMTSSKPNDEVDESYFYGTWKPTGMEGEDAFHGMAAVKKSNEDVYNILVDTLLVFNDSGEYFFVISDESDIGNWSYSSDGLFCDGIKLTVTDGKIYIKFNDNYNVVFEKASSDQSFPEIVAVEDNVEDAELVDGMRPEFKEAIDSYVEFFEDYCDIMEQYAKNPTDLTLLSKYSEYLIKYSEYMDDMEALDDGTLNDAEAAYYLEANAKIMQMLADIAYTN